MSACGVASAVLLYLGTGYNAADLNPSFYPLQFPPLPLAPVLAILIAAIPAFAAPPPPQASRPPAPRRKRARAGELATKVPT